MQGLGQGWGEQGCGVQGWMAPVRLNPFQMLLHQMMVRAYHQLMPWLSLLAQKVCHSPVRRCACCTQCSTLSLLFALVGSNCVLEAAVPAV